MSTRDQPENPYPSTQEQNAMSEYPNPWSDSTAGTDPTAAIPTTDPLGPAGSRGQAPTAALPQLSGPLRVEPATVVPDDRVPDNEVGAHHGPDAPTSAGWPSAPHRPLVTVARGPRPGTVLLGLTSLIVAAYALVANLGGVAFDLTRHLPAVVGVVGGLLLVVGLLGLVRGRRASRGHGGHGGCGRR